MTLTVANGGTIPAAPLFIQPGMMLLGWNTDPDGYGDDFFFGNSASPATVVTGNMTVYAQWDEIPGTPGSVITLIGAAARTVKRGLTLQIDVLVDGKAPTVGQVTWTMSNSNMGTISNTGKFTASKTFMGSGSVFGTLSNGMQVKVSVTVQ